MADDESTEPTVSELFAYLIDDDDASAAREQLCEAIVVQIRNVSSWLAIDSWLGGGDESHARDVAHATPDTTRMRSFAAVGLVAQVAADLVRGTLTLFRDKNMYGGSALVRQLIECEYLLRAFRIDFTDAARWIDANDEERWDFKPSKLRAIGGFDRIEYANHCEAGGHPHPRGRRLLELFRKVEDLERAESVHDQGHADSVRALWLDFTFHCDRVWRALTDLLSHEHARFVTVRSESVDAVAQARSEWDQADALASHAGVILAALRADPSMPLGEILNIDGASSTN